MLVRRADSLMQSIPATAPVLEWPEVEAATGGALGVPRLAAGGLVGAGAGAGREQVGTLLV